MANQRKKLFALILILLSCKELTQVADTLSIYFVNGEIKKKDKNHSTITAVPEKWSSLNSMCFLRFQGLKTTRKKLHLDGLINALYHLFLAKISHM